MSSKEMLGGCCVCSDDRGWPENPLVYCDGQGCNVAVHQACYGIVTVPSGPWFCRKCELHERPQCQLCPSREGAFKKTDQNNTWAHVVCALYIPEIRFGNVTTMEPVLTSLIPAERFNKTCYICEESSRGSGKANFGACMQCNKAGCKSTFHVTCAQMLGLLCEEAGNMMDNVKYCGYCQHHYAKLKATRHVKIIPPYRPVPSSSRSVSPAVSSHGHSKNASGVGLDEGPPNNQTTLHSGSGSSVQNASAEGGKSHNNISPDINSSSSKANNKNARKNSGSGTFHGASGSSKSGNNTMLDNKTGGSAPSTSPDKSDPKAKAKSVSADAEPSKMDDTVAVKLERHDEMKSLAKSGFGHKKDFSTLQLKEVVTAALDRPMTNPPGKFDHIPSSLTSGLDSSSTHGGRHSHGQSKIAPPDIRPVVTLTPIPLKTSGATKKEFDRETDSIIKTPDSNLPFNHPPKLQNQQASPDISEVPGAKGNKPPELTEEIPVDKTSGGPPTKRARGMSRDEEREREQRRTPTKGRGGRRGSMTGSGHTRRERECRNDAGSSSSAVAFIDDSSFDEVIEANGSTSSSVESSSRGRKPNSRQAGNAITTRSNKPIEDPPAPTLSQLKQSGKLSGGTETPPVGLAPHMFGNALNPSSSMADTVKSLLSEEMEAVVAAGGTPEVGPVQTNLIGIPVPGVGKSSGSSSSSTTGGGSNNQPPPQTLEQLLERQWEQGSQFLMEQAQHLDIAQLLSCLNQLKQDNKALEEHVQSLIARRDNLAAINARLSIPLGSSTAMGPLGGGFSGAVNTNPHHSNYGVNQGTPSPNVHPHPPGPHGQPPKSHAATNPTPSPKQAEHVGPHHSRERNSYMNSDLTGSRAELVVTHSSQGGPGGSHFNHQSQGASHMSIQRPSSYNSYNNHAAPIVTSLPSPHGHPPSRDGR